MDALSTFRSVQNVLILIVLPLLGYFVLSWIFRPSPKNLPPGPRDWGTSWRILKASWHGTLPILASEWALRYKDITFVYSFGLPLVFLNSAEVTRKLLASEKYKFLVADRLPTAAFTIAKFNGKDLIFSKFDAHLTTRSSLTGIFLCLVNKPEALKAIQGEIDRVIGSERPKLEHKSRMPYTEAAILESVRLISPLPLNGFRRSSEDIDFEGMVIPQNSLIFTNSWHFLHDENTWEDPWTFNPKRFLDSEGKILPVDHLRRKDAIAFGVGARACPGETFTRSRMFLFITSILQRYDLLPPINEELTPANFNVHSENVQGAVRQTPPFKCRLVRRQTHQQ